jgi:hypothetical protein
MKHIFLKSVRMDWIHNSFGRSATVVAAAAAIHPPPLLPSSSSSGMRNLDGWKNLHDLL